MTGCSLLPPAQEAPVYVPPGAIAEVATLARVECWITNKDTGKREKRFIEAQPGYYVGRPRVDQMGAPAIPAASKSRGTLKIVRGKYIFDTIEKYAIPAENSCPIVPK